MVRIPGHGETPHTTGAASNGVAPNGVPLFTHMDTNLTNEELADVIRQRVQTHDTWESIAKDTGVTRKTLLHARQTERWATVALEVIKEIKAEAFPVAWQGLLNAAEKGDVNACREILNRVDEVVASRLIIEEYSDVPSKTLGEIADGDGHYRPASADGADTEGAEVGGD